MSSACVDKNRIDGPGIMLASITVNDLHIRQVGQVGTTADREIGVSFDGGDVPFRPDELGKDRRIIPCAAADMNDMIPFLESEGLD